MLLVREHNLKETSYRLQRFDNLSGRTEEQGDRGEPQTRIEWRGVKTTRLRNVWRMAGLTNVFSNLVTLSG